jgi:hypothetical protein
MNFGVLTSARLAVLATAKSSAIETSHSDAIDNRKGRNEVNRPRVDFAVAFIAAFLVL